MARILAADALAGASWLTWAEDELGFPNMDFEVFFQLGVKCFRLRLPRHLVRQAFAFLCRRRIAEGKPIAMWQIRAFLHGMKGAEVCVGPRLPEDFRWPEPPDAAWRIVVCVYPDGSCELDMLHPVSRRFWSEDHGFFAEPVSGRGRVVREWYEDLGFEILEMQPMVDLVVSTRKHEPHLAQARGKNHEC